VLAGSGEVKEMDLTVTVDEKRGLCSGPSWVVWYSGRGYEFF